MDGFVTSPQSEPDQDNSSLLNPSTNPAEAGTTDETRDEEQETSSIEALNWSEVEEEELAAAQQAEALAAAAALGKENVSPTLAEEANVNNSKKETKEEEKNESSTNGCGTVLVDDGSTLSSSLLQSINSTISDEDPQARKLSVIENWASEVTNAVERGEMEMADDFPDDNGTTGDDEGEDNNKTEGVRKRKGKRLAPDMVSSITSSGSHADSSVDPLSNAPVLDDGPIWNKGPRSYTFQENRRINQKLTFCVLIAVVLAIGLGLGNLVAHQECEAEFKASQRSASSHQSDERSPVLTTIPTTTPSPIIPDRSTDSSMMGSKLPTKQRVPSVESIKIGNENDEGKTDANTKENKKMKREEPIIDPKYIIHAETVSKVVHTLDRLSRKIDQFENTTRKLQGVLMIPDEEVEKKSEEMSTENPSSSLYDEKVYRDDEPLIDIDEDFMIPEENEEEDQEQFHLNELINAIEQTPLYLENKRQDEKLKQLEKQRHDSGFLQSRDAVSKRRKEQIEEQNTLLSTLKFFQEFERRFIKSERKRIIDEGKYHKLVWKQPEQYTDEEKEAIKQRYKSSHSRWLSRLSQTTTAEDNQHALDMVFGPDEEIVERTYGDAFHYPWVDPELDLSDEEYKAQFEKNIEEAYGYKLKTGNKVDDAPADQLVNLYDSESEKYSLDEEARGTTDDIIIKVHKDDTQEREEMTANIPTEAQPSHSSVHDEEIDAPIIPDTSYQGKFSEQQEEVEIVKPGLTIVPSNKENNAEATPVEKQETVSKQNGNSQPSSAKVKREAWKSSSKPKRVNNKPNSNEGIGNKDKNVKVQNPSGKEKVGKRLMEQKQKEQKVKLSKNKANKGGNGSVNNGDTGSSSSSPKIKMSSKGKKLKNLESNKVFENVKGKNFEKRRGTPSSSSSSEEARVPKRQDSFSKQAADMNQNPSSTNSKRSQRESSGQSRNGKQNKQQRNGGDGPRYYDRNNIRDHQKLSKQQQNSNRGDSSSEEERFSSEKATSSQLKYETHDFSSKETQHRQHKQEFNTNYETRYNGKNSGKSNNGNKKGKNWQSKEKADRGRERATSWGN